MNTRYIFSDNSRMCDISIGTEIIIFSALLLLLEFYSYLFYNKNYLLILQLQM
jgi:hypothetical protein